MVLTFGIDSTRARGKGGYEPPRCVLETSAEDEKGPAPTRCAKCQGSFKGVGSVAVGLSDLIHTYLQCVHTQ